MAMDAQSHFRWSFLSHLPDEVLKFERVHAPDGVADEAPFCPPAMGMRKDFAEKGNVGSGCVLCHEIDQKPSLRSVADYTLGQSLYTLFVSPKFRAHME